MIENDIAAVLDGEGVVSAPFLTISVRPDANVPDDDVMRALDHQRGEAIGSSRMGQQYAAAGRGLPGNRQIGIADDRRLTREADDAAQGEYEGSRPLPLDEVPQPARTLILQVAHLKDHPTTPPRRLSPLEKHTTA